MDEGTGFIVSGNLLSKFPSIRVATWNLDHASNGKRPIDRQIEQILSIDPDVLILTETCKEVDLTEQGYSRFTSCPNGYGKYYSAILTSPKVCVKKRLQTYDDVTAVCVQATTPIGEAIIYGTIIAYHGYRGTENNSPAWAEHYKDIASIGNDWSRLREKIQCNPPLIVGGDFNQTRDGSSGTYGTRQGRDMLSQELSRNNLTCVTTEDFGSTGKLKADPQKGWARNSVDHLCITADAFSLLSIGAWDHFDQQGNYLSDHNGVYVDLG